MQCTYNYSADYTTTNTRQQNLIVQLTSEDIRGSALVKWESQNLMRSVQQQRLELNATGSHAETKDVVLSE
jgi:hypothetical protein